MQNPSGPRIGTFKISTFITAMGCNLKGNKEGTKPTAPTVLSTLTKIHNLIYEIFK